MHRFLEEEAKKQANIEDITQKALPHLQEKSHPENVENDWITNFFDKCRIISDQDMQHLWSRVLASEANTPGAFSKRTVNLLVDLNKEDAELFVRLCGFCWQIGGPVPLVYDLQSKIYSRHGIDFDSLSHLDSLGLIQFDALAGFKRMAIPKELEVFYYGMPLVLKFPKDTDNELQVGNVLLTRAGDELTLICEPTPVEGFFDYIYDRWAAQSLVPKKETEQSAPTDD